MESNSNPGTCAEFIIKLERFLDAKSVLQEHPRAEMADMVQHARKNLMEFIEKHFELR
jgi:hypothetical protein